MKRHLSLTVWILVVVCGSLPAAADYQVTGRFLYTDREYTLGGFTGNQPNLLVAFGSLVHDPRNPDTEAKVLIETGAGD